LFQAWIIEYFRYSRVKPGSRFDFARAIETDHGYFGGRRIEVLGAQFAQSLWDASNAGAGKPSLLAVGM